MLILLLFLVSAVVFSGVFFIIIFTLSSNEGKHKTDTEMIEYFNTHRRELNELNNELLIYRDRGLVRIDNNWTDPKDLSRQGIDKYKLEELRKKFTSLDIPRGISCDRQSIKYIAHTSGLSVTGGAKGYYYSRSEPVNFIKYPDEKIQAVPFKDPASVRHPSKGSYCVYLWIAENWYIYDEYED